MADAPLWHKESFALLHDARSGKPARLFANPIASIEACNPDEVSPALAALDAARERGFFAVGYFAYELGYALEPHLRPRLRRSAQPLLAFGVFEAPQELDKDGLNAFLTGDGRLRAMTPEWDERAYAERFRAVRDNIAAGDIYQANLTFFLKGRFEGAPRGLFRALQARAQASHGALFSLRNAHILSLSPELFIESDGRTIRTRPMKGTAPRAALAHDDAAILDALRKDEKTRAENLMIVDLLRNDLGRIARTGSVRVASLFDIETYPTLHQMTSSIEAELKPGLYLSDILGAVFPCGSITGAPKIHAMEILDTLEARPRGVYCGALGVLGPQGVLELAVSIRTLTLSKDGAARFGIGSGLVFDSSAQAEYAECLLKARFLEGDAAPPGLFETLRLEQGKGYWLRDAHLERICASARLLGYRAAPDRLCGALDSAQSENPHTLARVRLCLSPNGAVSTQIYPHADNAAPLRALLSARLVASTNPLLYHKTAARDFYDGERKRLAAFECDEILFLNERRELTEGTYTNLFIERDGMLLTPALHCGLLPGTLRRHLIETGRAREAVLTPRDLDTADRLWLGNSLRGLIEMRYCGAES